MTSRPFHTKIARKDPGLPRFFIVPSSAIGDATATFVALVSINGSQPVRRAIKPWGKGKDDVWFAELNEQQCQRLKIDTGDRITATLAPAEQVPAKLIKALERSGLCKAWDRLPASDRRTMAEHVFDAAKPDTAQWRIEKIVERLGAGRVIR